MNIAIETRALIHAALKGDPALSSLAVAGSTPKSLAIVVAPGVPAKAIGGSAYSPEPPFRRETLVEVIRRMQCRRWERFETKTGLLPPAGEQDLQALRTKHTRATVGFECWAGWTDLLDTVFTSLEEIAPGRHWEPDQIKEKYGTLRFYWHGDLPDLGDEIIEAAEHLSGHLCEVCGAPGTLQSVHGWWTTRCAEHLNWRP